MTQLGYFGKTKHRGDFVRFNLPKAFFTVMDDWLQGVMTLGETTHESEWSARYHASVGYRFQISADIAGEYGWFGVLLPSADKVGRRFPFCIAASLPEENTGLWTQPLESGIFREIEMLASRILGDDYEFDHVQNDMEILAGTLSETLEQGATRTLESPDTISDDFTLRFAAPEILQSAEGALAMFESLLKHAYCNYSIWVPCNASDSSQVLISSGLPADKDALALFDQQWSASTASHLTLSTTLAVATSPEPAEITQKMPKVEDPAPVAGEQVSTVTDEEWTALEQTNRPDGPVQPITEPASPSSEHEVVPPTEPTEPTDTSDSITTPVPKIEPLELDEDSTTTAPWD
ncbi:MAG: type VI secretion system-associated protein TagF [Gammaproteobacteria bacterium]|nr:type VI secretion system-associated protein TagF [Gammaproteobacteria bacterium]